MERPSVTATLLEWAREQLPAGVSLRDVLPDPLAGSLPADAVDRSGDPSTGRDREAREPGADEQTDESPGPKGSLTERISRQLLNVSVLAAVVAVLAAIGRVLLRRLFGGETELPVEEPPAETGEAAFEQADAESLAAMAGLAFLLVVDAIVEWVRASPAEEPATSDDDTLVEVE